VKRELEKARRNYLMVAFEAFVIVPTVLGLGLGLVLMPEVLTRDLLILTLLVAAVELLPVPAWRGLHFSVGLPLLLMVGILNPPLAAGLAALVGASDPRELRREVSLVLALFNRCQVALSVLAASATFHAIANITSSSAWILVAAAILAAAADYLVNSGIVALFMSIKTGMSPIQVVRDLRFGKLQEFLISYMGLAVLGLALAKLFERVGWWALPAFLAPMIFARQMFFRSQALEQAHKELQEREQVLRQLSNTMAEERADERIQIAGYLHDDLAQILFRLSIQVDVARKLLDKRDLETLASQLEKIRASKQDTSDRIRALIRDLHRSPLGAKGLAEALESFTDEVGRDSGVEFHRDIEEIQMPAPIALLLYHVAREGVMNALKHAKASDVWIGVHDEDADIVLELRDNGVGFDTSAPGPEGHFGMAMMRERAEVGGGRFHVESVPGDGTTITVRFPVALLQQEPADTAQPAGPPTQAKNGSVPGAANESSRHTVSA
jgi:signal transduction histidine kinase